MHGPPPQHAHVLTVRGRVGHEGEDVWGTMVATGGAWGVMVVADVHGVRGTHRLHANTAEPTQGCDIPRRAQSRYAIVLKVSNPPCNALPSC